MKARRFRVREVRADWKQADKPEAKVKADVVTDTLAAIAGLKAGDMCRTRMRTSSSTASTRQSW
jgi:hypothetical protein